MVAEPVDQKIEVIDTCKATTCAVDWEKYMSCAGLLTQGGQGRCPAPLASRLHRIPTHFLLNSHGIAWKIPTFAPPD